jgi:hypothetical protein
LQRALDLRLGWVGVFHPQGIKRHNNARCAKAALAAMVVHHGALHRVQAAIRAAQMLDRDNMAAIDCGKGADAGIHRLVHQPIRANPAHQHCAGPAIAFGAALFRAAQGLVQPQMVQQHICCRHRRQGDSAIIQQKSKCAPQSHRDCPCLLITLT